MNNKNLFAGILYFIVLIMLFAAYFIGEECGFSMTIRIILMVSCIIWMFAGDFISKLIASAITKCKEIADFKEHAPQMEAQFRSQAFDEFQSEHFDKDAYTKAVMEAMGDDKKLLPLYMKHRTAALMQSEKEKK